ncbi:PaaI family thioesterase [Aquicoccus porphyridii]|uniref:PaaI family thioesterase n=1 Tax=Aquicoccus porphyridii TaxID=1852029 RepID=A0A5A9Z7I2_9RHOB|nr:PaaI family thioesterase [Aquicoccus porphyridii]KAA0913019.1 PaaI family thioesterase [Aquicoccus porphyridii]RAI54246.1 PaaI family thioesterase [Rhodobacteraceae bacterium AsT-22]
MLDPKLKEEPYPFQAHVGFTITDWSDGYCRLEQPMLAHLGNRYGIPHGGVHATLLDTAMGYAICFTGDPDDRQLAMTLSLNVQYHAVAKGKLLITEGRRTGGGRSTVFAEGEIRDETGTIIATATGVFRLRGSTKG